MRVVVLYGDTPRFYTGRIWKEFTNPNKAMRKMWEHKRKNPGLYHIVIDDDARKILLRT